MIYWLLIVCTAGNNGPTCLPPSRLNSEQACRVVADNYKAAGAEVWRATSPRVTTRCIKVFS